MISSPKYQDVSYNEGKRTNQQTKSCYVLKPRTETTIQIEILNANVKEGICPQIFITPKVYLAKAIVSVVNGKANTTILNTSEEELIIDKISVELEPFDPLIASVFSISPPFTANHNERLKILHENLRLDHLNMEEKNSIVDLCNSYHDIFHLPGDSLQTTSILKHQIKVTTETPITTKIYRFPEVYKKEVDKQISELLNQGAIVPSHSPYNFPLWVVPRKSGASNVKKFRLVIDYRKLNDLTIGDAFPIPNIQEILDQLGHAKYFTTLDLASGFHQVPMDPKDAPKTAFSTPTGHYHWQVMPFGLKGAPSCFQRVMNIALSGLQGNHCFVYLDDVVIYASTLSEHNSKLKSVFHRLRSNNLSLQPDKCEFLRKEVVYLGHVINEKGVLPNPEKTRVVDNYPVPKTPKQVKQFLGLIGYYRRFVPNFAQIAKPLTTLLKKDTPFRWTETQQESFKQFKHLLTNPPLLQFPDFSKSFILTTDASQYAIGAVLSQGEPGKDLPIAYASRTLNSAESNMSTIERELLAIVWSTEHFRPYLFGQDFIIYCDHRPLTYLYNCKNPASRLIRWRLRLEEFSYKIVYKPGSVNSNADALSRIPELPPNCPAQSFLTTSKNPERYSDFIKFHYTLQVLPEIEIIKENLFEKNPNALIFSKDLSESNTYYHNLVSTHDLTSTNFDQINLHDILKLESNKYTTYLCIGRLNYFDKLSYQDLFYTLLKLRDKLIKDNVTSVYLKNPIEKNINLKQDMFNELIYFLFNPVSIKVVLVDKPRIKPSNKDEILKILKESHDSSISGHCGVQRTYKRIRENYKWNRMKEDIKLYIRNCSSCQINKSENKRIKAPMQITTTSERPFQRLAIDVVGPLTLTENGNKYIVTFQDDLTKYSYAKSSPNHEARTLANIFVDFISIFGIPEAILTDNGPDFTSNLIKEVNKLFKIRHILTSPYHPQSNGALERSHHTLKDYLKHYLNPRQTNWDEYVSFAMFAYNTHYHQSTNFTPFELVFGNKAQIPNSFHTSPDFRYTYEDYHQNLKLRLKQSFEIARKNLVKSKETSKSYYDSKVNFQDFQVNDFVYIKDKSTHSGLNKKLQPMYKGPYRIIKVNQNNTCVLEIKANKLQTYHHDLLKLSFPGDNATGSNNPNAPAPTH